MVGPEDRGSNLNDSRILSNHLPALLPTRINLGVSTLP